MDDFRPNREQHNLKINVQQGSWNTYCAYYTIFIYIIHIMIYSDTLKHTGQLVKSTSVQYSTRW